MFFQPHFVRMNTKVKMLRKDKKKAAFLLNCLIWTQLAFTSDILQADQVIRYVALGDSYTIGTGVALEEAWPSLLVRHLQTQGVEIELVANLAKAGWTSQNVIEYQLPVFKQLNPTFTTLLIGANDVVRGVSPEQFSQNLKHLLDRIAEILPQKNQVVLITIPDFSVTPQGKNFGAGSRERIQEFNTMIKKEAQQRQWPWVDLFVLSQEMGQDTALIAADGLHPSVQSHQLWEKEIYRAVSTCLLTTDH